ncbi:hypothetical protein G5714_010868 [Onychostoma macrolepis]|uniref:Uncharacterized protein n=1 Tax=Onychostoma macrolepis TaxID=369639 RepID=A0A7J6CLB8_9TELE|nr:hypothetical protein G5714_010868 [Onychostoma macrolepis]
MVRCDKSSLRVYGVGTVIGEVPAFFTAQAAGLSGTGPGDEACEEFAEMFHSTMVRIVRSLPSEQTLQSERFLRNSYPSFYLISMSWITSGHFPKPFLEFIFSAIRKTMKKTHTEKVFVIPSASTYSGADGGPHWGKGRALKGGLWQHQISPSHPPEPDTPAFLPPLAQPRAALPGLAHTVILGMFGPPVSQARSLSPSLCERREEKRGKGNSLTFLSRAFPLFGASLQKPFREYLEAQRAKLQHRAGGRAGGAQKRPPQSF